VKNMQHSKKVRYTVALLLLGIGVLLFVAMNVCIGTVKISLADIITSVMGEKVNNNRILWDIRL
jgi:ABC-type enterobactin transport system permease subunit